MDNVGKEIKSVVKMLRNHPSIVLWCGNNENYTIYDMDREKNQDLVFYGKNLFEQFIPEHVAKLDTDRFYWPSSDYSPSGAPAKSMKEGDRHSWNIPDMDMEMYKEKGERYFFLQDKARFVSEFGKLAFSLPETIRKFSKKGKIDFSDPDFAFHANMFEKPQETINRLKRFYGERITKLSPEDIITLSHIFQGQAIEFALKYYISRKYKTSGALFWMYEDSWATSSSWASVDYFCQRTPLFWFAKRAFSDFALFILPSFIIERDKYSLYGINNTYERVPYEIHYGICDLAGRNLFKDSIVGEFPPDSTVELVKKKLPRGIEQKSSIIYAYASINGKQIYDIVPVWGNYKETILPTGRIEITKDGQTTILRSPVFHHCVKVEGNCQDNYFSIIPGVPYTINGNIEKITSLNYLLND